MSARAPAWVGVPRELPRGREARRGHRRRQRPPHRHRARRIARASPSPRWSIAAPGRGDRVDVESVEVSPAACARRPLRRASACSDEAPPALPDDPEPAGRDHLHVGHDRHAEGRAVRQPPAAIHHPTPTSATTGVAARRSYNGTSCATPRLHDASSPATSAEAATSFIMPRWSAQRRARAASARERMTHASAVVPTQIALMLRDPDFDDVRPRRACSSIIAGGGAVDARASPRRHARASAPPLATRYSCTEAGLGLGTALDASRGGRGRQRRTPASGRGARAPRPEDDQTVAGGRGRRGLPALPRRDDGLLARSRGDARRVHRRRLRPHRRPRVDRRPRSAPARRAAARRCTCAAGTTSTRSRSRRCSRTHPDVAAVADRPATRRRDG